MVGAPVPGLVCMEREAVSAAPCGSSASLRGSPAHMRVVGQGV